MHIHPPLIFLDIVENAKVFLHKAEILRAAPAGAAAAFLSPKERVGIAMEKKKRVSFGMFLVTIGIVYGDIGT